MKKTKLTRNFTLKIMSVFIGFLIWFIVVNVDNPVSSKMLETVFHVKGTEIRRMVNSLRCKGEPICSDLDGYYYADNQHEINATIAQLSSRIHKIAQARDGLLNRDKTES